MEGEPQGYLMPIMAFKHVSVCEIGTDNSFLLNKDFFQCFYSSMKIFWESSQL